MFIIKVPGINNPDSEGCQRAGEAMIKELRKIHTNESGKNIDVDSLDLEEIHLDNSNLKLTEKLIYENSLETFEAKPKTIFLGGDQSISYPILNAFNDYCKNSEKEPCLIVFDAHPDCKSDSHSDSHTHREEKKNHPYASRSDYPTNEQWLRTLIEKGFPKQNILIVGMRNSEKEENLFLKENGIKTLKISSLTEDLHETCDTIMEFSNGKELYISMDIDVIDPIFAPSVSKPEAGGMTSREFLYVIQRVNKIKTLKALDITEINSEEDKKRGNITVKLGAKILSELI